MDQKSIIRSIAFILGVLLLFAVSWGAFKAVTEARANHENEDNVETLDSDVALAGTIDSLESHWVKRQNYKFQVRQDPFYLGRVLIGFSYAEQGYKETEEGAGIRLSATVTIPGDAPMAIVKFQGKSYVVRVGDKFNGYTVLEISEKLVILDFKGRRVSLKNKPIGKRADDVAGREYDFSGEY